MFSTIRTTGGQAIWKSRRQKEKELREKEGRRERDKKVGLT